MALTDRQLGKLYLDSGSDLEMAFLGSAIKMSQQILQGGYPNPTEAQTAWATAFVPKSENDKLADVRGSLQWGLSTNVTLQDEGGQASDQTIDYIVAEYAKL